MKTFFLFVLCLVVTITNSRIAAKTNIPTELITKHGHKDRDALRTLQENPEMYIAVELYCEEKRRTHVRHSSTKCRRRAIGKYEQCFSRLNETLLKTKTCRAFNRYRNMGDNPKKELRMKAFCAKNGSHPVEYDTGMQICCDGMISTMPGDRKNTACCGNSVYNPTTHICCDNNIKMNGSNDITCCGSSLMNMTSEFCYGGQILERPSEETNFETSTETMGILMAGPINSDLEDSVINPTNNGPYNQSTSPYMLVILLVSLATFTIVAVIAAVVIYKRNIRKKLSSSHNISELDIAMINICKRNETERMEYPLCVSTEAEMNTNTLVRTQSICGRKGSVKSVTSAAITLTLNSDTPNTRCSENSSIASTENILGHAWDGNKYIFANSCNFTDNLFSDAVVQTDDHKEMNMRDSFGSPFQFQGLIDVKKPTLQLKHSTVTLILSKQDLENGPIHCGASSFYNISAIRKKLDLDDTQQIVSPAVEYWLPQLSQYAVIKMPCVCNTDDVEVWKVKSDEGVDGIPVIEDVTRKDEMNDGMDLDTFYVVGPDRVVYIYSKVFSWYVCICRTEKRTLGLRSIIYGSMKEPYESRLVNVVDLTVYIVEELQTLGDFNWPFRDREEGMRRRELENKQIDHPDDVQGGDNLDVSVSLIDNSCDNWQHRKDADGAVIHAEQKRIKLHNLVQCHCRSYDPYKVDWCFINNGPDTNCFQCVVNVEYHGAKDVIPNKFIVDEIFGDPGPVPQVMNVLPPMRDMRPFGVNESRDAVDKGPISPADDDGVRPELSKTQEYSYAQHDVPVREKMAMNSFESLRVQE